MKSVFRNSEFARSVVTLITGTVAAQIIAFALYPLLTQFFYTEDDMGELGLYTRFVAFIAAFATARYDFAMPVAKQDNHAFSLFRLSLRIAFVCLFAVLIFGMCYALIQPKPGEYLVFILMSVGSAYGTVWINIGTNWAIRKKQFKVISNQRVINALGVNGFRLLFGFFNLGALGLLLGSFLGTLASSVVFIRSFLGLKKKHKGVQRNKRMNVVAKEYRAFPTTNLPHVLLDLGVDSILAWSMVYFFDKGVFGQYSLAFMILKTPLSVVGQSVGQVFFNRASELVNQKESVVPMIKKTVGTLFLFSIVPFTVLFVWGDVLFGYVFGWKWMTAGHFAQLLTPYLMINFLLSPISSLPLIVGRQREMFFVGILVAIIQLTSFVIVPYIWEDIGLNTVLMINSLVLAGLLIAVYFLYIHFAKLGRK